MEFPLLLLSRMVQHLRLSNNQEDREKCQSLLDDIDKIVCKNLQDKASIYQEYVKSLIHV